MTIDVRWRGPLEALDEDDRATLLDRAGTLPDDVREQIARMAERVVAEGDEALLDYTRRFDDVRLDAIEVPAPVQHRALDEVPASFIDAFQTIVDQVRGYHETLARNERTPFQARGVTARERTVPLARAGIYVPGGQAAYPSTVAMTVVPAQVAGVSEVTVATPPSPSGAPHPLVLAACQLLGVDRVLALGGAQAVLALALGTETVPAHPVVAGPGNVYVQAAKEHVAGRVRIDAPAGPSEVAVLADATTDPSVAARELVAQAEHDTDTLAVAVCLGEDTAAAVAKALDDALVDLPRADVARQALAQRGAILSTDHVEQARAFLDQLAPEHCALLNEDHAATADALTGPACIVHGPDARVALTDYAAGPSHVLPTGGHAAAYGGIDLTTFTKKVHVARVSAPDDALVEAAKTLARLEGLDAHARSLQEERT